MCLLCQISNDKSQPHIQAEVKKLRTEKLLERSKVLKEKIRANEIWLQSNTDGWETNAVEETLAYLKEMQYAINRVM